MMLYDLCIFALLIILKYYLEKESIILGIDPGTTIMGYGLIKVNGSVLSLLSMGVIKLNKLENQSLKLKKIFEKTLFLVDEYHPDILSIEAQFFGKNVQSMLKLGRAQGVAIAAALYRSVPVVEYSPRKIKQSITGNGNASKEQVANMLTRLFNITEPQPYLDASDGLATAVCHAYQKNYVPQDKKQNTWEKFITANPERIK